MTRAARPAYERVLDRCVAGPNGCVIYTGYRSAEGYGRVGVGSRADGDKRPAYAHRVVFEAMVGPIPEGLHLDHLCRVPACVNPEHLEPVTSAENVRRGFSPQAIAMRENRCGRGHSLDGAPVQKGRTSRICKECHRWHWALIKSAADALGMSQPKYRATHGLSSVTAQAFIDAAGGTR